MLLTSTLLQIPGKIIQSDSLIVNNQNSVAELIKEGRFEDLLNKLITWGIDFAGKLLIALVIFFIGKWLIKRIRSVAVKLVSKKAMDPTLKGFMRSIFDILLYILLILLIINVVGTQTVSLAALIGAVGLALGLAVKDNLANFAGGVMLLFNKPFKSGEFIEAQNVSGTVESIGILYTTLKTFDNKMIFIPNGPLSTGNIVNYSAQRIRRVDLTASVDYGSNIEQVKKILLDIAYKHDKVLKDPEPTARMTKMNDSSIDFSFRVWTKVDDYWTVNFDLNEEIYNKLNENNLNIPFPQLTVHMANNSLPEAKKE
ncbi:MAG: mechanosensitive ion channel [Petrimonas sp.]|nr:mechanosensitive ion channel [Petrimonas sp.]